VVLPRQVVLALELRSGSHLGIELTKDRSIVMQEVKGGKDFRYRLKGV